MRENHPLKAERKEYTLAKSYQKKVRKEQRNEVGDALENYVREGARRMLAQALEEEVNTFLERDRYERGQEFRGYRNGYHPKREITVGLEPVEVRVPRVSDVPCPGSSPWIPVADSEAISAGLGGDSTIICPAVPGGTGDRRFRAGLP